MEPFQKSPVTRGNSGGNTRMDYKEIKSHSSLLSNERVAILFYMLDLASINLNSMYNQNHLLNTKAIQYQIYKNIRSVVRNNAAVRNALNLSTKEEGVYTTDVAFDTVEKMIQYCTFNGFTYKRCYIITQHLNYIELMIRDILQYFSYFFRPEFKQKPDIMIASERYKEMADKLTVEQLRGVIGKNNKIDFKHLGMAGDEDSLLGNKDEDDDDVNVEESIDES
jgi:hypothetical protein